MNLRCEKVYAFFYEASDLNFGYLSHINPGLFELAAFEHPIFPVVSEYERHLTENIKS